MSCFVWNRLSHTQPAYLAAIDRFYKNWSVPSAHQERLSTVFSGCERQRTRTSARVSDEPVGRGRAAS